MPHQALGWVAGARPRDSLTLSLLAATLASQHVALCLIPEMPLDVDSMLAYLIERVEKRGHAVVVVAEGVQPDGLVCEEKDASGNTLLADVGAHLKARIKSAFKARDMECNIKVCAL